MEERLLPIAKRFWPDLETMSGRERTQGVGDVVGFLYSAPLALVGLLAYEHAYVQAGQSVPLA